MISFGLSLYRRTDEVPGLFFVATRFVHVCHVPLIPIGSYLVEEATEGGRTIRVHVSAKSIVLAWVRAPLFLTAGLAGILALPVGRAGYSWTPAGLFVAATSVLWLSYGGWIGLASHRRALELAEVAGLSERGRVRIDLEYGLADPRQADQLLEAARVRDAERVAPYIVK